MDKEWIHLPSRLVPEYEEGVQKFIAQARNYAKTREVILCPCKHCKNKKYMKFDQVYDHLIINGFDPSYTIWVFHGEIYTPQFQGQSSSGSKNIGNVENVMQHVAVAQSNLKNVNSEGIHDNTKCKLLHWCGDEVVAEGRVASKDPKAKVHHIPLERSCWKVWIDKVLVEKVDLIRPNDEMFYLDDAIGSTVAWLSKLIVMCD